MISFEPISKRLTSNSFHERVSFTLEVEFEFHEHSMSSV